MTDQQLKASNKSSKNQDSKKAMRSCNSHSFSKKQSRKGQNPTRFTPAPSQASNTRVCTNSGCKAVLSVEESFCRSCSCCLCHQFDNNNEDPSLWLVCKSDNSPQDDSCGLACHIECAFQHQKVGVVNLGQFMQLDGSYWCAACGKVSEILGCWKMQLFMATDARRVDVLCQRIFLSYKLLSGTSRFKALHQIVKDAKCKLEEEVGPINEVSRNLGRGTISRLCVAADVQKLCADAIAKADEWIANASNWALKCRDSPTAACRLHFEDVTSSSVAIFLIEIPTDLTESVKGYKLWYWRTQQDPSPNKPILSFSREQTRIVINDLQSCTEYTFRVVSFAEGGDFGNSEASCFTKSVDINPNKPSPSVATVAFEKEKKQPPSVPLELDLNVALMPDLNEEVAPVFESSGDEDNGYTLEIPMGAAKTDAVVATVPRKRSFGINDETFDCDSTLVNGSSPFRTPVANFEGCVKTVRWLECQGHIKQDFRLKFLTWFSFRSTEQERQVVDTFIRTLSDEPKSLAGQLVDSFADIITNKRTRH